MLIEVLLEHTRQSPKAVVAKDQSRKLNYAQFTTFAKAIRRLIMQKTRCQRVGMMLPASVGSMGTLTGVLWAGKTVVPLNFLLQPGELSAIIRDSGIDLIITTEHFRDLTEQLPARGLYLEKAGLKRRFLWEKLSHTPEPPVVAPQETAAIVYTSGTSGRPKGVCLSHDNLVSNARAAIEHLRITPDNHLLGILPPFHVFGLTVLNFVPLLLGAPTTFIPRFSPQAACRVLAEGEVSIMMGIPSMYGSIARLKTLQREHFAKLKLAVSGGEPLSRTLYHYFEERTGVKLLEGYGLTETSPVISADLPWRHRPGTVGLPLPDVEIQVRDNEGRVLETKKDGELYVRGPLVMQGYYNRPEETALVIDEEGWFRTGDMVRVDDEGYITITGRAKELIIVGGENVYPREVEDVLEQHPALAETAVVGTADPRRGEVVVAYATLNEGEDVTEEELRQFCRKHLAGFKVPRRIHIVPDLPRGPTGKVLKRQLVEA
jgi:long-chain acyl-CoA synthetase